MTIIGGSGTQVPTTPPPTVEGTSQQPKTTPMKEEPASSTAVKPSAPPTGKAEAMSRPIVSLANKIFHFGSDLKRAVQSGFKELKDVFDTKPGGAKVETKGTTTTTSTTPLPFKEV